MSAIRDILNVYWLASIHLVEHFQGKAEVRVLDNLRCGFKQNLAGFKHEFIEASILDREAVRQAVQGVDYVFHLAALISVPTFVLLGFYFAPNINDLFFHIHRIKHLLIPVACGALVLAAILYCWQKRRRRL